MAAFDVSALIADFYADASQTYLELPHMTTGQRKQTKKLLGEYPELRCESYGFGAERCLHLFKPNYAAVEAKVQSSAPQLDINSSSFKDTFTQNTATFDEASAILQSLQGRSDETGHKSTASSDTHPELILPLTFENLQIRNTFIHMCAASADERAVQSLPHGMFKKCLLSEAAEAFVETYFCDTPTSAGGDRDTPTSAGGDTQIFSDSDVDRPPLHVGALVVVEGLVKLPAYNGRSAVVEDWDEATGRYSVLIACPSGQQQAKVKAENLRMIVPCPR